MPRVISESRSFHLKIICNSYDISRKPLPHWAWRKKPWQSGMIKFIYFEMVFDEISKYYSKVLSIVNFFWRFRQISVAFSEYMNFQGINEELYTYLELLWEEEKWKGYKNQR